MKKCVCVRECFIKHESDRPTHYERGQIVSFQNCPSHFSVIEDAFKEPAEARKQTMQEKMSGVVKDDGAFNFGTASEELLMAGTYEITDLILYAKTVYGVSLSRKEDKATTVARFVDARYRAAVTKAGMDAATKDIVK